MKYVIRGNKPLYGDVKISGFKNAAASILPGLILVNGVCRIENVPDIDDVRLTFQIMKKLGAKIRSIATDIVEADSTGISCLSVPYELGCLMRASHFFLGSLLGRFGQAAVPLPGGCDLGTRPIDQHLKGFEAMGAKVQVKDGFVYASVPHGSRLKGANIRFDMVTVGATMNLMLAATLADGITVLENAAKEPHIVDLAAFLNAMGGDVQGAGTNLIKIRGVRSLHGGTYSLIPDQIEAGTYMAAVAAAGGEVRLTNVIPRHLDCISSKLREMNVEILESESSILVRRLGSLRPADIVTMPYPGFPTDMQPQMASVLCLAEGTSQITEAIWEDRFRYAKELCRMGARITVNGRQAVIHGVPKLTGANVTACDLRAGAAMIIAGLAAEGITEVGEIHYIERGYQNLTEKLAGLGADIRMEQ